MKTGLVTGKILRKNVLWIIQTSHSNNTRLEIRFLLLYKDVVILGGSIYYLETIENRPPILSPVEFYINSRLRSRVCTPPPKKNIRTKT